MAVTLPLLILIVGGIYYDTRLLYVAAAVAFILFPTLLLIAWNNLLTRQSAVNATFPQTVLFSRDDEISVRYYPLPASNPTTEQIIESTPETGSEPSRNPSIEKGFPKKSPYLPKELIIPSAEVTDCRINGNYLDIIYTNGNDLLVPISALPSPDAVTTLLVRYARPLE